MNGYDLKTSAALWAEFSGVMGGFAFTALVLILTLGRRTPDDEGGSQDVLTAAVFIAFTGFVYATVMFSAVGSEEDGTSSRANSEFILADIVAFLSFMHLFLGLQYFTKKLGLEHAFRVALILPAAAVPAIGYGYVLGDVFRAFPSTMAPLLASLVPVLMIYAGVAVWQRKVRTGRPLIKFLNFLTLAFMTTCALFLSVIQVRAPSFALPASLVFSLIVWLHALMLLYAVVVYTGEPSLTEAFNREQPRARASESERNTDHNSCECCSSSDPPDTSP
jgi:hypothetical protein